ncbi:HlyD family type I secretion periplasmic adaptor subunit [Hansschlegelia beijingensis]
MPCSRSASMRLVTLLLTTPLVATLAYLGEPDFGAVAAGYLGAACLLVAFYAIGLFASALARSEVGAFVIALAMLFVLLLFGWDGVGRLAPGSSTARPFDVLAFASPKFWLDQLATGEVQLRALAYFALLTALAVAGDDPQFATFLNGQQRLFETSVKGLQEKQDLLQTQISRLRAEVAGARARISGSEDQRALVDVQIADTHGLLEKGLARKPQMLDLQRRRSELDTEVATLRAQIKRSEIEAVEKQITLQNAGTSYLNDVSAELAKARAEIAGMRAKLAASDDVLTRTQVLAPDTGYVLNLQVKTVGGVVKAGQEILQIVPTEGDLVIEGRVSPQEIRSIEAGQAARVSFTTFPMRDMPMIPGRVVKVAADIITDPQTRESFYTAQVAVDRAAFSAYANPADMKPGTPVEAYVESRKRVAMEYFIEPVVHSFRKSFREQ